MDNNLLRLLALELDMPSLLNLCLSSKRLNREICQNNHFWRNKLYKDYPETKGKVFGNNLRKVYLSLLNRVRKTYYVFASNDNEADGFPEIFDYIKDTEGMEDKDYEKAAELYPDFNDRFDEEITFQILGDFPSGTKIWLAYNDDLDLGFAFGFISREQAIQRLISIAENLIESDFERREEFIEELGITPEEFYNGTYAEDIKRNRETLEKTNRLKIPGHDNRRSVPLFPIHFLLKEFAIP